MAVETVEMSYQEAIQPPQQKADAEAEAATSPEAETEESANEPKSAG
jgi:hypothetical protein